MPLIFPEIFSLHGHVRLSLIRTSNQLLFIQCRYVELLVYIIFLLELRPKIKSKIVRGMGPTIRQITRGGNLTTVCLMTFQLFRLQIFSDSSHDFLSFLRSSQSQISQIFSDFSQIFANPSTVPSSQKRGGAQQLVCKRYARQELSNQNLQSEVLRLLKPIHERQ